jgi:hypothetical protein
VTVSARLPALLLALATASDVCAAQRALPAVAPARVQPTLRADVLLDRDVGAQFAAGVALAAAYNVRLALDVGAGGVSRPSGWRTTGRADALVRWLSDPFRQSQWAISGGGGIGLRVEQDAVPRAVAVLFLGLDMPTQRRWVPGFEVGLGGGVRLGMTLRRAASQRR